MYFKYILYYILFSPPPNNSTTIFHFSSVEKRFFAFSAHKNEIFNLEPTSIWIGCYQN